MMSRSASTMEITAKEMEMRPNTISDLKVDASFRKIAKNAMCFHVWKIDEDRLEAEPKGKYGTFYDDGAYIIYAAGPAGTYVHQDTITRETKVGTPLERFIHFWLGERVSEQKRSNVAHKIQELDTYFGNTATEYRETQDNESARFLSYFKRGISILSGALAGSAEINRLYQLRGRKWLRCIEMDSISWEHFSANYVMLLRTEEQLFIWIGRSSSAVERRDAINVATKYQTNKLGLTMVDDGYEQSMPDACKKIWNTLLPLNQRVVSQKSSPVEHHMHNPRLYKCGYRANRLHLDQLNVSVPDRDSLSDSSTVYVLDYHTRGVWLWVGQHAVHQDNISAMGNGRAFVKKKKYPYNTPVIRVVEGHEPPEFTRLVQSWHSDWSESKTVLKPVSSMLGKFDSLTLCQRPKMAADTQLVDDGTGERTIYCITSDQVLELPHSKVVMFTMSNCYVVRYTVVLPTSNTADAQSVGIQTIIYQWNGSDALTDVIGKAERFAKAAFESSPEQTMYVQMNETDETPHFLQIFDGKLIVLQSDNVMHQLSNITTNDNNNNSNHNNDHQNHNKDKLLPSWSQKQFVLLVHGDASYNAKAVEVTAPRMNVKECYIVKGNHVWVWCGQSSTGDTREMAKHIGTQLGECSLVLEGNEPKDFWRFLATYTHNPRMAKGYNTFGDYSGDNQNNQSNENINLNGNGNNNGNGNGNGHGNGNSNINSSNETISPMLNNAGRLAHNNKSRLPQTQMFLIWSQYGSFCNQQIIGYEQADLSPECVYVLDTGALVYVWLGEHVCSYEREKYLKMAQYYLEMVVPTSRKPSTAVAVVRQHSEPNVFKGFFDNWNHGLWHNYVTYEMKRRQLLSLSDGATQNGNSKCNINGENGTVLLNHQKEFDKHHKYPLATLQQEIDSLPAEVNPLKREVHLTHDDFVSVFRMSFWEFDELPGWKKQELKKKYKLF